MEELTAKSVRPGVNIMIVLRRPLVLAHMLGLARQEESPDRRRGARRLARQLNGNAMITSRRQL